MKKLLLVIFVLCTMVYSQEPTKNQIRYNALMHTLDFATTTYVLQIPNIVVIEMNPMMRPIIENPPLFIAVKVLYTYLGSKMTGKQLKWYNVILTAVVVSNTYRLSRL